MLILAIETSCDETCAAVLQDGRMVLSNIISSQIGLHRKTGGVIPEVAAREHLKNIIPVIKKTLNSAKLSPNNIDLIAVTQGPGLIPALLIGTNAAKTLAYLWKKPLIGIHHIEGHIYANFLSEKISVISNFQFPISKQIQNSKIQKQTEIPKLKAKSSKIKFPILCLVVSGGHTQLVLMKKHLDYEIIGETLDDAAGEAFDKVARILGLGYPGGPAIAKAADIWTSDVQMQKGHPMSIHFPRPMIGSDNFNFSFSGLKTAVLYETKKRPALLKNKSYVSELCHEFQQAVIDVLVSKTIRAAKKYQPKTILLAGGVSANAELRNQLGEAVKRDLSEIKYYIPDTKYSLDNAAMIAAAAYYRYRSIKNKKALDKNWQSLEADASLKLK